jgi:serine/threonine-protein kinase
LASEFERLQAALPKRYTLLRELDIGGMSRVYLAREALPDRDVAIKVFDEQLSARLGRERFVREVEVTSKLSHPHIVPLYAAGEADGTLYYVMPFIGGESLRDRLAREGRLPIADAIRITHQIADALQHAHDKDVIHRDIKPANILFQSGHAVVADFGIARALRAAETGELTVAGLSVGTPDYMSPEQAGGEGQIDGRTDTYALACVLYEMLGGQPPFLSRSPQATLARHLTDSMPSLRSIRDSVSIDVEATIRKALSKAPADRHATTMDFANELQAIESGGYAAPVAAKSPPGRWDFLGLSVRIAGALLVVAAIGLAYSAWSSRDPAPAAAAPSASRYVDSIAVMPFTNRTGDPALEGLGQSIADEVNRHLAAVSEVKVIARYSVVSLWNSGLGFARLMDSLQVGHLIDGYYEMRGGELVVMVEEIDPAGVVENVTTYTIDPARLDSAQLAVAHACIRAVPSLHRTGCAS